MYRTAVLVDGPIGYWRLGDPVAPTAKDETGGGHDGTYLGGVKLGVPGAAAGDIDTAADFDGTDDRVSVPLPSQFEFIGKEPFSVEAWFKRTSPVTGGLSKGHYDAGYDGWYMVYNGSQAELFQFFRAGSSTATTNAPPDNAWFHAVATFDGFTLLLYVNGVEVASSTNVNDMKSSPEPLAIGRPTYWGAHKGSIDEVAIYDKPLPPARVKAHYDAAQPK